MRVNKKRKWKMTTDSNNSFRIEENKINQDFSIADKPNKVWGADITYIPTLTGWLYLAIIIDFYSRKIIGYSCETHMRTEMVSEALKSAIKGRSICRELIHHSDRGSQYASDDYKNFLLKHQIDSSMSRRATWYDNSMTESFFATLLSKSKKLIHYDGKSLHTQILRIKNKLCKLCAKLPALQMLFCN